MLFQDNKHTAAGKQGSIAAGNINQLDRTFYRNALRHIDHKAVLRQHRIKGNDAVRACICRFAVVTRGNLRTQQCKVLQPANVNALRESNLRQFLIIESIVHHKIQGSTQIGHITTEHIVRIDGKGKAVDIYPVVRGKSLSHVRMCIVLTADGGKARLLEA
ncbi:hypothetical protein Barb6_03820 [Bacteroidales bacterium Barb6]|nr:hypothetical protein Barb6_03820 [Bacteroidales bacterium Barb6]